MKKFELNGNLRKDLGRTSTKKARNEETIPCVMYGGKENVHFTVTEPDVKGLIYTPNVYIVKLLIDGNAHSAILQSLQFHPVTDKLLHIDFLEAFEDKSIVMNIPIKVTGNSEGVKKGGKLSVVKRALKIKALPKNMPDILNIAIDTLDVGQSLKVGDLNFEGITVLNGSREPVVSILASRATKEAAVTDEKKK